MDAFTNGIQPGTASPASGDSHGLALLGTDHRAAVAVATNDDAVRLAGADGIGVKQGQADEQDCAARGRGDQAHSVSYCEDKRFSTLRARLALAGYSLTRTQAGDGPVTFYAARWNLVRELRDLAAVEAFAEQVGAR